MMVIVANCSSDTGTSITGYSNVLLGLGLHVYEYILNIAIDTTLYDISPYVYTFIDVLPWSVIV